MFPELESRSTPLALLLSLPVMTIVLLWSLAAGVAAQSNAPDAPDALPVVQVTTDATDETNPALIRTNESTLLTVFTRYGGLWSRTSADGGATWGAERQIDSCCRYNHSLARLADGTLWLVYDVERYIEVVIEPGVIEVHVTRAISRRTSTDGGVTWSAESQLLTGSTNDYDPAITQTAGGALMLVFQSDRTGNSDLWYKTSTDGGATWSADQPLTTSPAFDRSPTLVQAPDGRILVAWVREEGVLLQRSSTDAGLTWSVERQVAPCCRRQPSLAAVGGDLWLSYEEDEDIWVRRSADSGATWLAETRFTRFVAEDSVATLASWPAGGPGLAWHSARSGNGDIWYGRPGEREDDNPPPYVDWMQRLPECGVDSNAVVTFRAEARDETGVVSVYLVWQVDGSQQENLALHDDGLHGDEVAGDGIWGVRAGPFAAGAQVTYDVCAADTDGNALCYGHEDAFTVLPVFAKTADVLYVADHPGSDDSWYSPRFTDALDRLGYSYDTWQAGLRCGVSRETLMQYADGIVIWATPYEGRITGDMSQLAALQAYLDAHGRLFLTGQNIARWLSVSPGVSFLDDYLHATFRQDDSGRRGVAGVGGDPIGDGLAVSITAGDGANNQYSTDVIEPIAPAVSAFTYQAGENPSPPACPGACTAAVRVDTGSFKVAYLAFGFEAISTATDRAAVMERSLAWLAGRTPRPMPLAPAKGATLPAGPVRFSWLAAPGATSYAIQVDQSPAFDAPGFLDVVVPGTTYTLTLTATGSYYWRVRALHPAGWGEWTAGQPFFVSAGVIQVTTDPADDTVPALVQTAGGRLLAVFVRNGALWSRTSMDDGATWAAETQIDGCCRYNPSLATLADGTLWLAYDRNGDIWSRTSVDSVATWSGERQITGRPAGIFAVNRDPAILQAASGRLWVVWHFDSSYYCDNIWGQSSVNGGASWSAATRLSPEGQCAQSPTAAATGDGRGVVVYASDSGLWQRSSTDDGAAWLEAVRLTDWGRSPGLAARGNGLWLVSEWDGDIWLRTSTDRGVTWTDDVQVTRYAGPDVAPAAAELASGGVGIAWQSDRSGNPDVWYGIPAERTDLDPPPYVTMMEHRPWPNPDSDDAITIRAQAQDETGVAAMHLAWRVDDVAQADLPLYDDGLHGDSASGDGIWGAVLPALPEGREVTYRACAADTNGNRACHPQSNSFTVLPAFVKTTDILFVADVGGYNAPYGPHGTAWYQPFYGQALAALGRGYDPWDVFLRGDPSSAILDQYRRGIVVWAVPFWGSMTDPGSDSISRLKAYLDGGGRLFITGQNIAQSLAEWSGAGFLEDYLHATLQQEDTGLYALAGAAGDPIGDGLALNLSGGDGANNQYSKDEIDPIAPAEVVLTYRADAGALLAEPIRPEEIAPAVLPGTGLLPQATPATPEVGDGPPPPGNIGSGTAAVRVDTGVYKVVYFAFGFEAINRAADRAAVMGRVLDWLGVSTAANLYLPLVLAGQNAQLDSFWADSSQLEPGSCTLLHWSVINAQAVFFNGEAVPGQDTRIACPYQTTTYELVVVRAGVPQAYRVTITIGAGES